MVNFDEILLLGIGILSLGFLNKNRGDPSVQTVGMSKPFVNPYLDKLQTSQVSALNQLGTSQQNLENIRLNNLEIAQNILNVERQRADVNIDFIQSNLDEARSYVSEQQKVSGGSIFGLDNWTAKGLLNKFDSMFNYYSRVWTGEKGRLEDQSVFPDVYLPLNQSTRSQIQQAARVQEAQENIQKVQPFILSSEQKIIDLNAEYTNKYGDISRYS
tara:strand:+ start:18 stop:662 length:645 start_codon:yes stop_codon:yes gene_type:complete